MNQPSTEARIAAQESLTTIMHAKIEQLSQNMSSSFREVKQDISQLSDKVDLGFRQAHVYIDENMATKEDLAALKDEHGKRFDTIEATMATKEDIAALKATQDTQGQKLDLILQLLQRSGE